jgi:hypothetical protein
MNKNKIIVAALFSSLFLFPAISFSQSIEKITRIFFEAVKAENYELAYVYVAADFKEATSKEALRSFIVNNGYHTYEKMFWPYREISSENGLMKGYFLLPQGVKSPLTISFVSEYGEWKIYNIKRLGEESEIYSKLRTVPDKNELSKLVNESFRLLADAINKEDFAIFHNNVSDLWKPEISADELKKVFSEYIDKKIDLTNVESIEPDYSSGAKITEEGYLIIDGFYPTVPVKTKFSLKYNFDAKGWKLISVDVDTKE